MQCSSSTRSSDSNNNNNDHNDNNNNNQKKMTRTMDTSSVPEAKVNSHPINHHICTIVIEHSWDVILTKSRNPQEFMNTGDNN